MTVGSFSGLTVACLGVLFLVNSLAIGLIWPWPRRRRLLVRQDHEERSKTMIAAVVICMIAFIVIRTIAKVVKWLSK